jgi:hypothetical protein
VALRVHRLAAAGFIAGIAPLVAAIEATGFEFGAVGAGTDGQ